MRQKLYNLKQVIRPIKHFLQRKIEIIEFKIIPFIAKSGFLSSVYYTFFNTNFYREHRAVLSGRVAYKKSLAIVNETSALLRRNVHRLEKGLIMKPRRSMFAAEYLEETVLCYKRAVNSEFLGLEEIRWATDVLNQYFEVIEVNEFTVHCKQIFEMYKIESEDKRIPYKFKELNQRRASYEQLLTVFKRRRSVRWYLDKEIPSVIVEQAIEAASLAPSACNRQPYKFIRLTDKSMIQKVSSYAMGTAGWLQSIQNLFIVIGNLDSYVNERDRHVIYIDGSLAAMQFMLACETLDLATCPINWPDIEKREKKLEKALGLRPFERPIMLIAVGYPDPDGGIPYSAKKESSILSKDL